MPNTADQSSIAIVDAAPPARAMQPHRWLLPTLLLAGSIAFVLATFFLVTSQGIPFVTLTRDAAIAYTKDAPFYGGYLSNLGAMIWCAAAAVTLFAAATLRPLTPPQRETRFFLAAGGLLTAVLMIDDLFMLHDGALRAWIGRGQNSTLLVQGTYTLWLLWRFRRLILQTRWSMLAIAMACFAMSLLVDMVDLGISEHLHHLYEEGPKMVGIVMWSAYFVWVSGCAMNQRHRPPVLAA